MNRIAAGLVSLAALSLMTGAFGAPAKAKVAKSPRVRMLIDAVWRFRRDPKPAARQQLAWQWRTASVTSLNVTHLPTDLDQGDWFNTTPGEDVFHNRLGFVWYRASLP